MPLVSALLLASSLHTARAADIPPRTITDIAAILAQEKPDAERVAIQQAKANAAAPDTGEPSALASFYAERAEMRGRLGRVREAIADLEKTIGLAQDNNALLSRSLTLLGQLYGWSGETKKSLDAFTRAASYTPRERRYNISRWMGIDLIALGDLDGAERYMQQNRDLLAEAEQKPRWSTDPFRSSAEAHVAFGDAAIFEAKGRFEDAAAAYERAEDRFRDALAHLSTVPNAAIRSSVEQVIYWMPARAARVKAREGKLVEAEIDVRRALLGWLKLSGKYDLNTARIIDVFALILVEEGRAPEAEQLSRTVIEIYDALGTEHDSQVYALELNRLAGILALQNRWNEAANTYQALAAATKDWQQERKDEIGLDVTRIFTAYNAGDLATGMAAAKRLVERQTSRYGRDHAETALAQGVLGIGLARAGRTPEALSAFASAVPSLVNASIEGQGDEDDSVAAVAREDRIRTVIESYVFLLSSRGPDAAAEAFRLAEAIRGRSVQRALASSSARAIAGNAALAELVRNDQDIEKRINARLSSLDDLLALPPSERDDKTMQETRSQIEELRKSHAAARVEIQQKFPDYANLIDPKPATIDDVRSALRPDEALLSFYFGREHGFVWAVSKTGRLELAVIPISEAELDAKIAKLRLALEPGAETIGDIPPFDLKLAYELYGTLLQPVQSGWKQAKELIVVTNGALGLLPLGLLPTAPAEIIDGGGPLFAGYRKIPWLIRTQAVTTVPSAAALLTLRRLPPASRDRGMLVGVGDPYFNADEAAEAADEKPTPDDKVRIADATATRGLSLRRRSVPQTEGHDSVTLKELPRLPDTADELRSIALALNADPAKALHLGKDANEDVVKTLELSKFKIVVFATHGLRAGDLDGLKQPALALTAPDVAGVSGDGLLTMEEVLSLKLDADWVVLSACNSGAGNGANAEASSGLARAFFYAGSRAVLVTNWSVHSASARELVSDLFRRQAADSEMSRAEALQKAMIAMIDSSAYKDDAGGELFTYAHPLFWAPYSIIGDGGASR
ncbi:MAG TPA: CHAT domain-containing protein [Xanthobacteraceae bacterium]|nr:CHAT domain-containing protein [Xanthobacteraceae bacterium]